jgi:hypothetical protein
MLLNISSIATSSPDLLLIFQNNLNEFIEILDELEIVNLNTSTSSEFGATVSTIGELLDLEITIFQAFNSNSLKYLGSLILTLVAIVVLPSLAIKSHSSSR